MTESVIPEPIEGERWLPVAGYEGLYAISDQGRVRSFHAGRGKGKRGGLLKPGLSSTKHLTVVLYKDHRGTSVPVHILVARAFLEPPAPGLIVLHGPGGILDNRAANLSYGTSQQNSDDTIRDETRKYGTQLPHARLTEGAVAECRRRYADGERLAVLTAEFGVTTAALSVAIAGHTWQAAPGVPVILSRAEADLRRGSQGESHHAAKLTDEIVRECRRRHARGATKRGLAREFGVAQITMQRLLSGATWSHVS